MRPLTLRLEGLRSYRSPQTVDFTDRDIVAIVGDTGAGKSSLLEAITFALYGGTTWSKQAGDLIGDRSDTMKVELTFVADGARWQVTRTMSNTTRASTHRLVNLDTGDRVDGAREIGDVVRRIIGLDYDGFLRTVLLPQGKFAQLLEAGAAGRQKILRNVFRVDELDKVRERAKGLTERLDPKLVNLRLARGQMADDPHAAAAEAAGRADQAEAQTKQLEGAAADLAVAQTAALDDRREADRLGRVAVGIDVPAAEDAAGRIRAVATADGEHEAAVATAEAAHAAAMAELEAATGVLEAATAAGDSEPALRAARTALVALPDLAADIAAQLDTRRDIDARADDATRDDVAVGATRAELTRAEQDAGLLDEEISNARRRLENLQAGIGAVMASDAQLAEADAKLDAARQSRGLAEAASDQAAVEAATADDDRATAESHLDNARRADAAAHAAAGLAAGDSCPVCERALPDGFRAPTVPALAAAENTADAARAHAAQLAAASTRAATQREAAVAAVDTAEELVEARSEASARARATLATVAGVATVPDDLTDTAPLLGGPTEVLTGLQEQRARADQRTRDLHADVVQAQARADALRAELERARTATGKAIASCRTRLTRTIDELAPLSLWRPSAGESAPLELGEPESLATGRPDLPDLVAALDAADPTRPAPPASLGTPKVDVAPAVARIDERLAELAEISAAVRTCTELRDRARTTHDGAVRQRHTAAAASGDHYRTLDQLSARINDAARHVGAEPTLDPPPDRAHPDGLAAGAAWAEALLAATRTILDAMSSAADTRLTDAKKHDAAADAVLERIDVRDVGALNEKRAAAMAAARTARAEQERALADAPLAEELDRRIAGCSRFVDAVSLVRDRLANSAFIGEVMRRRHAELLGVASRIVGEVTDGRYGFSPDFAIVDLHTGQERATKTLSGGESFLASLALALAMVEIAGRGGGRLDALFLDEGFGSLDRTSLDAAIDALEARAKSGRLVALISHVAGVAERMEDVLEVRETPAGSVATWLTTSQREESFAAEATSAVSALL